VDQYRDTDAAHRPVMAGPDWLQVIAIATLVISIAGVCIVFFAI